jgi:hypothetical protein
LAPVTRRNRTHAAVPQFLFDEKRTNCHAKKPDHGGSRVDFASPSLYACAGFVFRALQREAVFQEGFMANVVVVGSQWGDEGKGKIVDWLSERADVVVRFQGGHNAGHTLVIDGVSYKLSLLALRRRRVRASSPSSAMAW